MADNPNDDPTAAELDGMGRLVVVRQRIANWQRRMAALDVRLAGALGLQDIPASTDKPQPRVARISLPDGLRTKAEAAAKLACSIKTLDGYIDAGALRYVIIGHGKKRPRKMFADADLAEFITNQTRKDSLCPSDATRARRSGSTTFKSEIIAFSEVRKRRTSAKPKK